MNWRRHILHLKLSALTSGTLSCFVFAAAIIAFLTGCGNSVPQKTPVTGLNLPSAHNQIWAKQIQNYSLPPGYTPGQQGTILNTVEAVVTDPQGNVMIGGYNAAEFENTPGFQWSDEGFVAKYDPSGSQKWIQQFGNSGGYDQVSSVLIDDQGHIYACGSTTGAFPGYSNPTHEFQLMLARLTSDGTIEWVQQYPVHALPTDLRAATLAANGIIVFWGNSQATSVGTGNASYLEAIDPASKRSVWHKQFFGFNVATTITSNTAGDLFAVGQSQGEFPGSANSDPIPVVLKFDGATGDLIWKQQFDKDSAAQGNFVGLNAVQAGTDGELVVGGASVPQGKELCEGLCLGGLLDPQELFLAKLDSETGAVVWSKQFGTGTGDGITTLAVSSTGEIYAAGFTDGRMASDFSQPANDLFLMKLTSVGEPTWVDQFGTGPWIKGPEPTRGLQMAMGTAGQMFVSAETEGALSEFSNPTDVSEIFLISFHP